MWFRARHPQTGEPLEVEAEYYPAYRGSRDKYGAPEEPDSPPELEITAVYLDGALINFSEFEADLIEAGLREIAHN